MKTECHDVSFHYTRAHSVYVCMMVNFAAGSCTHHLLQICYISENKQWRGEESIFLKQQRQSEGPNTSHSFGKPSSKLKSHLMFIWKCSSESCLNLQPDSVSGCCLRLEQKWSITYSRLWEVWITMAKNRSFGVSLGQRVKAAMAAQGDTSRKTKIQDPSNMNLSSKGKEAQNLKPTAPPPEIAEKTEEKQLPVRSKTPCASAQGTLQRTRVLAIFIEKQWLQEFANFWWCCYFTFKQRQPK